MGRYSTIEIGDATDNTWLVLLTKQVDERIEQAAAFNGCDEHAIMARLNGGEMVKIDDNEDNWTDMRDGAVKAPASGQRQVVPERVNAKRCSCCGEVAPAARFTTIAYGDICDDCM